MSLTEAITSTTPLYFQAPDQPLVAEPDETISKYSAAVQA